MPDNIQSILATPPTSIRFNQDGSCFIATFADGFSIFLTSPLTSIKRVQYQDGGLALAEMLYDTNLIALVGGGPTQPRYPHNHVVLWDDRAEGVVAQIELRAEVRAVRMREGVLVAAMRNRVFVYGMVGKPVKLGAFDAHNCSNGTSCY